MISVIIPVYNVEKYISRCIESLLEQTYEDFEVLLIDDGSTDNSGPMCDEYAEKDQRIKVFHNENVGFGLVRNYGLKKATGTYISFVDSDDTVAPKFLENLIREMEESRADVVLSGFKKVDEKDQLIETQAHEEFLSHSPLEDVGLRMVGSLPGKGNAIFPVVWGGLYSSDILKENELSFLSEREFVAEDLLFNLKYLSLCRTVKLLPYSDYNYRIRNNSVTRKFNFSILENQKKALESLEEEWTHQFSSTANLSLRISKNYLITVRSCLRGALKQNELKKEFKSIREITNFEKTREVVSNYPVSSLEFKQKMFIQLLRGQHNVALFMLGKLGLI